MSQVKHWCLTSYDVKGFKIPEEHKDFVYCVYQVEKCPKTQKEHIQGYVEWSRSMKMGQVKKAFNQKELHLEPRQGSRAQARTYCMKEDSRVRGPFEHGVFKEDEAGKRNDLELFAEGVRSGKKDYELAEEFPAHYMRYAKYTQTLRDAVKPSLREPPEVIVLWGPTGSGKTRTIYDGNNLEDIFRIEGEYKWFDGYQGQSIALFDEFYCQFKITYLLQLLDRYPIKVPVKGGFVNWKPSKIYITSNYPPDQWYSNVPQNSRDALARRITQVIEKGGAEMIPEMEITPQGVPPCV